jgi:hypothetical protein
VKVDVKVVAPHEPSAEEDFRRRPESSFCLHYFTVEREINQEAFFKDLLTAGQGGEDVAVRTCILPVSAAIPARQDRH